MQRLVMLVLIVVAALAAVPFSHADSVEIGEPLLSDLYPWHNG